MRQTCRKRENGNTIDRPGRILADLKGTAYEMD